eukprot:TRINITY_DN437_c0_g1_i1.p1 TRINITY_DN437_c0_g1~~TRINITY_DN437_c0_g1_i1.p1  ORF type:complete len:693 (+),score=227.06 TRINITY_DN437_c0_g1_i1:34-2079(+)
MGCCGSSDRHRKHPQYVNQAYSVPAARDGAPQGLRGPVDSSHLPNVKYGSAPSMPTEPGLFRACQEFILRELLVSSCKFGNVLIIDKPGIMVLESLVKVNDLTKAGVPLVDSIDMVRQPMPQMPAVYFVVPTPQNANKIVADWEKNAQMYQEAHIIILDEMSAAFRDNLARGRNLQSKLKSIKHLKLDFLCNSQHSYVLTKTIVDWEQTTSLQRLYGHGPSIEANRASNRIADGIVSVLANLGDRPTIRYQNGSHWAETIAGEVQRSMLRRLGPSEDGRPSGQLLIVDRTFDLVTPLLHHFTYEAMLHDLQPQIHEVTISEKFSGVFTASQVQPNGQPNKVTELDARDETWQMLRYGHFDTIRRHVASEFKKTLGSDAAKLHPDMREENGRISLNQFTAAVRELPLFQKKVKDLSLHTSILVALGKEMEYTHSVDFAMVEQNLATNEHEDKETGGMKKLSRNRAWKQLLEALSIRDNSSITFLNKLRVTLIFVLTQNGISPKEHSQIQDLFYESHPNEPGIDRWLQGLSRLDVQTEKEQVHWWEISKKKPRGNGVAEEGDEVYLVSRAVPRIKGIMASAVTGNLSREDFPVMDQGGAPVIYNNGVSNRKAKWSHLTTTPETQAALDELKGPRLHVFVIGGVTPAEMQAAAMLRQHFKRDIVIGGTEYLPPLSLLEDLASLH